VDGRDWRRLTKRNVKAHRLVLITKDANLTDVKGLDTLWSG
jgi:hypothetical protein